MDTWEDDTEDVADQELRDFTFGGKDALIFVVDASEKMHVKIESDEEPTTPLQLGLKAISQVLRSKIFTSPNDLVGVLLFGTEKQVDVRDFNHLSLLTPLAPPSAELILKLNEFQTNNEAFRERFGGPCSDFSLHEALWQCQSLFGNATGKIASKKILLMTADDNPHSDNPQKKRQAMQKTRDLNDTGVTLEVLPLCTTGFAAKKFYGALVELAGDPNDLPLEEISSVDRLEDLTRVMRKKIHKKRSIGKSYFDFGDGVKISVATYNFVQKADKPSKVKLSKDTNEEVKVQRNFINQETGAPLLPSDINKFQEYGGKRIKFTIEETKSMAMLDGNLGFKLCGFKPLSKLKWSQFVRPGSFIYPDETLIKGSRQLFAALLIKCSERKVMAICSFKARDNTGPSFVALVPQLEVRDDFGNQIKPAGFHVVYLPFADDIRSVPEAKLVVPEPEQLEAAKKVVKKLSIKKYNPDAFENPDLQTHYNIIESLALNAKEIPETEDLTLPPIEIQEKKLKEAGKAFLEAVYPEDYNPSAPPKRKAPAPKKEPTAKKAKTEDDSSIDMKAMVESKSVAKLTVAKLKEWLQSVNVSVSGKKKADLVDEVYNHFSA